MIVKAVVVIVVIYIVVVGFTYAFQRSLMYFPATDLPPPIQVGVPEMTEVALRTADGLDLVAWYAAAPAGRPTIVYFHGNGGNIANRADRARTFIDNGYGVLLVSYRGYAGNPGKPNEDGLFADGRAALAFAREQGISADQLVLVGESLGSGVAVRMASESDVAALILEAPFTSAADTGQNAYPFLPVKLLIKDRFDSLSRIGQVRAPLLIVHGERDRVVPTKLGRRLFAAANEPKQGVFLPGAGHNDLAAYGLLDIERDFLRERFGD